MDTLPDELITEIVARLPPHHVFNVVSRTSRRFLSLSRTLTAEQGRPWFLADIAVMPSGSGEIERNSTVWLDRFETVRVPPISAEGGVVRHIAATVSFVVTDSDLASLNASFLASLVAPARLEPAGYRSFRTKWIKTPEATAQLAVAAFLMRRTTGFVGPFKWATTVNFLVPVLLAPAAPSPMAGVANIPVEQVSVLELLFMSKSDSPQLGAALNVDPSKRTFQSLRTLELRSGDGLLINDEWVEVMSKMAFLFAPGSPGAKKVVLTDIYSSSHSQKVPQRGLEVLIRGSREVKTVELDARMFLDKLDSAYVIRGITTLCLSFPPHVEWESTPHALLMLRGIGEHVAGVFQNLEELQLVGVHPRYTREERRWSNLVLYADHWASLITASGAKRATLQMPPSDSRVGNGTVKSYLRDFLIELNRDCQPRDVPVRIMPEVD